MHSLCQPVVILVETQLDQNIGKTARAMLNFGLTQLRLVAPKTAWLTPSARALAAGADQLLEEAVAYTTFEEAVADLHTVFATTARPRDMIKEVCTPKAAAAEACVALGHQQRVGFVFGPERSGLANHHISRCQKVVSVPLNPSFNSLNLAQAVVVMAYEWYQAWLTEAPSQDASNLTFERACRSEVEAMVAHLDQELAEAGYYRTNHKRPLMQQNLFNLFARIPLTVQEIRTLRGIISTLVNPHGIRSRMTKRRQTSLTSKPWDS